MKNIKRAVVAAVFFLHGCYLISGNDQNQSKVEIQNPGSMPLSSSTDSTDSTGECPPQVSDELQGEIDQIIGGTIIKPQDSDETSSSAEILSTEPTVAPTTEPTTAPIVAPTTEPTTELTAAPAFETTSVLNVEPTTDHLKSAW